MFPTIKIWIFKSGKQILSESEPMLIIAEGRWLSVLLSQMILTTAPISGRWKPRFAQGDRAHTCELTSMVAFVSPSRAPSHFAHPPPVQKGLTQPTRACCL